jgi:hypothetical protein
MSRSSRRTPNRLRAALLTGAVLGTSVLAATPAAQATAGVVDLQATILRLGGSAVTGTNPIPSGRTLTPVTLTTADPFSAAGDGTILNGATPSFRIGRTTVPGTPAEQVTFRINGAVVATAVPDMRATLLQTDAGSLTALMFTAGGVTYAIPAVPNTAATRTVAQSAVNTGTVGPLVTHRYGLLPVGAQTRVGTAFTQSFFDGAPLSTQTQRFTVLDADNVRRNASAPDEELVFFGDPAPTYVSRMIPGTDVLATVSLSNGSTAVVRGVRTESFGTYGSSNVTWFFERAALAAAGATIADVTGVVSSTPSAHTLTWQDLGFDLA